MSSLDLTAVTIMVQIIIFGGLCSWWLVNILEELRKIRYLLSNKGEDK